MMTRQPVRNDVGTLWMMRHLGRSARCALIGWPEGWEVRVLVDGQPLLSERCVRADDAFALAEGWKLRMLDQGWKQVVPSALRPPPLNEQQSA